MPTTPVNTKAHVLGELDAYAGLYADNFSDGYAMNLALTAYLQADFTSPRTPNDPAGKQP